MVTISYYMIKMLHLTQKKVLERYIRQHFFHQTFWDIHLFNFYIFQDSHNTFTNLFKYLHSK